MRGLALTLLMMASGSAWADHTKEDAQATTKKLEAILHPPKKTKPKPPPPAPAPKRATVVTEKREPTPIVDPITSIIVHAMSIPFDDKEREAHLRDIPKNAKELDAQLRRLDAALEAQHQHR